VFGDHAASLSISATKSAIGHTLGAAGAIGTVAAIMAMRHGCVPPTLNVTEPDPSVGELDVTPLAAKARDVRVALVNAFGFGGQNSVVLYRRWDA
jgi:3-oxoacyl-[acyl-carrier-protein] synthase II